MMCRGENFSVPVQEHCESSMDSGCSTHFALDKPAATSTESQIISQVPRTSQRTDLARELFFFSQNHFPTIWKHHGPLTHIMAWRGRDAYWSNQHREPNCAFRPGRVVRNNDVMSSNSTTPGMSMPDGIGCAQFVQPCVRDRTKFNYIRLPTSLQRTENIAVNDLFADALSGKFPTSRNVHVIQCPPLHRSYSVKHCLRAYHGYEAFSVHDIPCDVIYHFIMYWYGVISTRGVVVS